MYQWFMLVTLKSLLFTFHKVRAVGTISTSQLFIEPYFLEARKLKEWFDKEGTPLLSLFPEK